MPRLVQKKAPSYYLNQWPSLLTHIYVIWLTELTRLKVIITRFLSSQTKRLKPSNLIWCQQWKMQWPVICSGQYHYLKQCCLIANWSSEKKIFTKMDLKMSSTKLWPFCVDLNSPESDHRAVRIISGKRLKRVETDSNYSFSVTCIHLFKWSTKPVLRVWAHGYSVYELSI